MPPLAELQHRFAQAVMTGKVPDGILAGRVAPSEALSIHRGTMIGALTHALRLSCPTVDALVGAEFFDQTCSIFIQQNMPRAACLTAYGEGFAQFLAYFVPAAALPYLPDVARLDRAIETALRAPDRSRRFALDEAACIDLPQSLRILVLDHPVDEIRAALGDDDAMAAIDMTTAERFVLVWRTADDAAVRRMDAPAARFLQALLDGQSADAAFAAAIAGAPEAEALQAIQSGILAAPFCTVISNQKGITP